MRRTAIAVLGILAVLLLSPIGAGIAVGQSDEEAAENPPVRMARATWDTGWFQAEVYRLLVQRLGYRVEGPLTMNNDEFYEAVAAGEVDLWANGWFPTHDSFLQEGLVEPVGTQVDDGALQGYFMDRATAEAHGITNLGDLSSPELAALFDQDGNGLADLIGCEASWGCAAIIDHHLEAYGLTGTVEQVQGSYSPLIRATFDRYRSGQPVLYYTWTPNWTVGELQPGRDVVWLETPFPSLPADQASYLDQTSIAGIRGCANDPCGVGWPPNDIRAVANTDFLEDNPSIRRLLEQVVIPLPDISAQNALMVADEGDPEDIRRHAKEWVDVNEATVERWIAAADPEAVGLADPSSEVSAAGGRLPVAVRLLAPFAIYDNRAYSGFEVELARLLAARLGMEADIYAVDTVAKQIDDINRGVARVALGGVAITESRERLVDFSMPVLDAGLTILAPTESSRHIGDRIVIFFRAIVSSDLPWLLVLFGVAVLVSAHVIWWLERHHNADFAVPYRQGIWDSFYWSVVTMSTVGYGDKVARGAKGRVFALVWIALGTLVFASFTASIASSLAVNELRGEISGPSDLPGHRVATVTQSAGAAYMTSVGVGPVLVDEIGEAYLLLESGEVDAVVFDAPVLHFHAARQGGGEVATVGPDFEKVQYGLVLSEDDTEFREQVNLALLDLIESGVYRQLHDRWFGPLG
ncbi:MAG: glycine betaine/L-proline ABC transporter substrate-binding protein ProX [bacterium]|nr:glycine betaine/L-proline ABC transporter substrate-binding protein ProX [Acidimicrobiia bacterium]MCY4649007.1 glycine betaine/L-proline ABC transporter substrate-binding protein ProX [bacterium]